MNTARIILLVVLGGLLGVEMYAQTKLQVVTRIKEQIVPYEEGYEVNIEGERAEIFVDTWDQSEVRVVVELIAKHPDLATAERDVHLIDYKAQQYGKQIYIRNYIDQDKNPTSNLKAIYTVTLPAQCPVYLKNNFGSIDVKNTTNSVQVNSEYSTIALNRVKGNVSVMTRYGDLEGDGINGTMQVNARRSDVSLRNLIGNFDINSQYGVVKLFANESDLNSDLLNMNITADKSDVFLFTADPIVNGYNLTAHYGEIIAPIELKFNYLENTTKVKKAVYSPSQELATISIKINFGDIVIRRP